MSSLNYVPPMDKFKPLYVAMGIAKLLGPDSSARELEKGAVVYDRSHIPERFRLDENFVFATSYFLAEVEDNSQGFYLISTTERFPPSVTLTQESLDTAIAKIFVPKFREKFEAAVASRK